MVCRENPEEGLFIAESALVIERALDAGFVRCRFWWKQGFLRRRQALLSRCPVELPVYTGGAAGSGKADRVCAHTRHALCDARPAPKDAAALLRRTSCVAVLEDVVNPTNLGAIFRSAAALGVEAVLLTPNCTDPLYRRAIRVSMGNVFLVPWAYLPDDHWQALLKESGFQTVAMALREDARVLWDPALTRISKLAVVMGSEGPGAKAGNHRRMRLHGDGADDKRRGLFERCGGKRRRLLPAALLRQKNR